ncbi:conserved repeat domain-containing protein, partial [Methanobrevibacter olleyae]
ETGNGTSNATNNNVSLNNVTLRVTKVSDKSVANVGDKVTYIITVVNVGSTSANGVSVSELIPKGLTLINNSWNTNKWTKAGNVWTLVGALNGGSSATLKLVFLVNGKSNGTVVNDVLVMSNETGNGTVNATNNNVTLNVTNGSDRIVDNSTASNTNNYVYRGSIGMKPTGNPLAIFIMVIFVLFVPFRRFKK